jgi:hypothetical protein
MFKHGIGSCVPGAMQRFFSAASQNRDRTEHRASYGPGSAAHRSVKSYALRCVRGTRLAPVQRGCHPLPHVVFAEKIQRGVLHP